MMNNTALPEKMTVIAISEPGEPSVLKPEQRVVPKPGDGEILIRVRAAGINRPDVFQRKGLYPAPPGASDLPGLEVAGEVAAVGENVKRWQVGDRVAALTPGGGYAEYCLTHETNALPIPRDLTFLEAAAIPETFFTVWHNVYQRGGLKEGETLLVHGGSSGIGTTAIQLAKALGSKVIATAGSAKKCAACTLLGAVRSVNYCDEDFVEAVKEETDGHGADVILDMIGGDYIERNYEAAAMDGRIVQIAFLKGPRATVDFSLIMRKRLTHTGSTLRPRSVAFKARIATELEAHVWPLLAAGRISPVMDEAFPLEEAWRAHERMEDGAHIGKIVLNVA
ncbi:NAD(P)H-quinone oxidoreductase [Nitratireductor kimnyeongensis]|uniref:NAD(P)H-quinone oxidoreductase n=1 Tax=Nitratireductor kimnyeongensis TaxID=430679 RepID=A0ABW0TCF7_9HYPH|nr:NAD(P)H-quinone oxidoreductase [Nitratireductor kimnyeongensis]QZZ36866.1 NAD(P)H-quinone oxidoreductase [Nitratireductor kimnyeongensis]